MTGQKKMDTKILIMYLLRELPGVLEMGDLYELCLCDRSLTYFDFIDCANELVESGQIEIVDDNYFRISEKGKDNVDMVVSSLPFSTKRSADKAIAKVFPIASRNSMIKTQSNETENGVTVSLSLSDGVGKILDMELLCADIKQANIIKKKFRQNAEEVYKKIIEMLS